MTGNTQLINFNTFFVDNYNYLLGFAKSIDVRNDYESLLHNCYLKCHKRIDLSGYSGTTYLNFMRVTIMNTYKSNYRDKKYTVDIYQDDVINQAETELLDNEDYHQQRKDYDNEMSFLNTMAFEYVNKYFNSKQNMIFKTYYVLKHKHLTYKQLSDATNINMKTVSNTIKHIKKELQINLLVYINFGKKLNELNDEERRKYENLGRH